MESKAPGKRPSTVESPKPSAKKQKKSSSEGPKVAAGGGTFTGTSPRVSSSSAASQAYTEKKPPKEKGRWAKGKNDALEPKEPKKVPDSEDSNSEDDGSSKSEVRQHLGSLVSPFVMRFASHVVECQGTVKPLDSPAYNVSHLVCT